MLKSKRDTQVKPSILIDTTFLMPALGVGVEKDAEEIIPYFRKINVYYLEIGLLEAMWKIIKIAPQDKLDRVKIGIEAIRNTYNLMKPSPRSYIEALMIYRKGHRDYIDALHYTTAKDANIPLLTIDQEFIEFLKKHGYDIEKTILKPEYLKRIVKL